MKILIVEDELIIAEDIKSLAHSGKHKITGIVSSGKDALKNIEREKPDVVFMDIGLKGEIDGIETSRIIFEKYQIRVIYLTSFFQKIPENVQTTQPYAILIKPVVQEEILQAINKVVTECENLYSIDPSGSYYTETYYSKILNY